MFVDMLRKSCGSTVVVQGHKVAFRGLLVAAKGDGLELSGAAVLDEEQPSSEWIPVDGRLFVPAPQVRFVQVVS